MTATPAIRVRELGKRYRLGATHANSLHELASRIAGRLGFSRGDSQTSDDRPTEASDFWSLRDVSFDIQPGEVVGVIGANGAGKSTLLKILSRITWPTTGRIEIRGRVASLLEVGTGFHPELTGRENVYLNGAILGMRGGEVRRKFDSIVDFSGVEKFIDTPVKRYSSGMKVRLAFAVATHLEPEILMVDEVLAVGDAEFQRKCFKKISEIGVSGRTILLVSHNMAAVRHICSKGLVLRHGEVSPLLPVDQAVDGYLASVSGGHDVAAPIETATYRVCSVAIRSLSGVALKPFDPVEIAVRLQARVAVHEPGLYAGIVGVDDERICGLDLRDFCSPEPLAAGSEVTLGFRVDELPLLPGRYHLILHLKEMRDERIERLEQRFPFDVAQVPVYGGRLLTRAYGSVGLRAGGFVETTELPAGAMASAHTLSEELP